MLLEYCRIKFEDALSIHQKWKEHYHSLSKDFGIAELCQRTLDPLMSFHIRCSECMIPTGLARTVFMEARSMYGPSIDICTSITGQMPPLSTLAGILTDGKEFQVSMKAGAAFGLRLVPAAQPRRRTLTSLKGVTSFVTGGAKVRVLTIAGTKERTLLAGTVCL